jgi:hypothetical protein
VKFILYILVLVPSILSFGQDKKSNYLNFKVLCAAGAQTSLEIESFKHFNEIKNYISIREKLFSDNLMDQVLSVILLTHYSDIGEIVLTNKERQKIKIISKSKYRFHLCFTCLSSEDGTLRQLFSGRRQFTYELVKGTMLDIFPRS